MIDTQIRSCTPVRHGSLILAALAEYEARLPRHWYVKVVLEADQMKLVGLPMGEHG